MTLKEYKMDNEELLEFEQQEKADREADDYLLEIIMKNPN